MVELMVAMILLTIALVALAASIPYAMYGVVASGFQTTATLLAQEAIERAKAADYGSIASLQFDGCAVQRTACSVGRPPHGGGFAGFGRCVHVEVGQPTTTTTRITAVVVYQRIGSGPDLADDARDDPGAMVGGHHVERHEPLLRDTRGLSLTELVVTLALFAIVMVGVVGTWGKAQEAYFIGIGDGGGPAERPGRHRLHGPRDPVDGPGRHGLRVRLRDGRDHGLRWGRR